MNDLIWLIPLWLVSFLMISAYFRSFEKKLDGIIEAIKKKDKE